MAKEKTVFDVINPTNTVSISRHLVAVLGHNAALIYSALLSKSGYYSAHKMLDDGWFYSTIEDLNESTLLSGRQQSTAIKKLVDAGLIRCERKGLPAKRYFYIENDIELLEKIIAEGEEILKKIKATAYTPSREVESCNECEEDNHIAEEINLIAYDESKTSVAEMSNKSQHSFNSCSDKKSQHSYNPKGNNLKLNSINQPQTKKGKMDRIDNSENRELYLEIIKENVGYDALCDTNAHNKDNIDEIVSLITDVVCTSSETIRIGKENKPAETVRSVFLKLTDSHIQYVIDCMKETTSRIRNIKNYLLTALYNAKFTINNYYQALVNHDLYGATS